MRSALPISEMDVRLEGDRVGRTLSLKMHLDVLRTSTQYCHQKLVAYGGFDKSVSVSYSY